MLELHLLRSFIQYTILREVQQIDFYGSAEQ